MIDQEDTTLQDQLVEKFVERQEARIKVGQLTQEVLFFVGCQVASASLAIILFKWAVIMHMTALLCLTIAWLPLLSQMSEFSFNISDSGWSFTFMGSYFKVIFKFVFGVGVVSLTIHQLNQELVSTTQAIAKTMQEIKEAEYPTIGNYLPPYTGTILLVAIVIVSLGYFWDKNR